MASAWCTRCPASRQGFEINSAITLPVGIEAYGAFALGAWLAGPAGRARDFARRSAIGSLLFGMLGQVAYHLLSAAHATRAPWPVVVAVSCMPVVVLGFGAGLAHLLRAEGEPVQAQERVSRPAVSDQTSAEPDASAIVSPPRSPACGTKWLHHPDVRAILDELPTISGAELGRKLGVSARQGQRIMSAIADE